MNNTEMKKREELINELVEDIIKNTPNYTEEERGINSFIDLAYETEYANNELIFKCDNEILIDIKEKWIDEVKNSYNLKKSCEEFLELLKSKPSFQKIIEGYIELEKLYNIVKSNSEFFIDHKAEDGYIKIWSILNKEYGFDPWYENYKGEYINKSSLIDMNKEVKNTDLKKAFELMDDIVELTSKYPNYEYYIISLFFHIKRIILNYEKEKNGEKKKNVRNGFF